MSSICIAVEIASMAIKLVTIVVVIARTALIMVNIVVVIARTALNMVTIAVEMARMDVIMVAMKPVCIVEACIVSEFHCTMIVTICIVEIARMALKMVIVAAVTIFVNMAVNVV